MIDSMRQLPVILCFGRSGGTLANKMLGSHPDCMVLSEINPADSFKPVVDQAVEWLQLVEKAQAHAFALLPYAVQIRTLDRLAEGRGKRLVVRDWTSVNFVAGCSPYASPSCKLEQLVYLDQNGMATQPIVVVRRSAEVFASWKANLHQFANLDARVFSNAYLDYAAAVKKYPVMRLEDLRADPRTQVARLFDMFGLAQDPLDHVLNNFHTFERCTGNNTLASPGASDSTPWVLPPVPVMAPASIEREAAAEFAKADSWLGYE